MRRARWSVASANGNETMCLGGCVGKAFDVTDARDAPGQRRVSRAPELPRLGAHAHHRPNDAGEHRAGLSRRPCRRCARSAVALIFRREKTTTPRVRRRGGTFFSGAERFSEAKSASARTSDEIGILSRFFTLALLRYGLAGFTRFRTIKKRARSFFPLSPRARRPRGLGRPRHSSSS